MRSAGGIEPSGSAGERRRALWRRGSHDGRNFGCCSPRTGGALAFSLALCGVLGCGLVELTSTSVDDGSIGGVGGGTRVGRDSVGGVGPGWARGGRLGRGPDEEGPVQVAEGCGAEGLFCAWLEGGGGKRCDRSRTAPRRSRSSVSTGELANCECRRCTVEKSSSILSPRAETAWMVFRRNGSMITSPEERVLHSFGEREGIWVESSWMRSRVRSLRADRERVSSEAPTVEEEADGRAGNCPNKGGGGGPAWDMARA